MSSYTDWVKEQFKDTKTAILAVVFTVARIIYGYAWVKAGLEKAESGWFTIGKPHAYGLIANMANNMLPPKAHGFDPLYINKLWAWVATNIFNQMPPVTDFLVVICEIAVGVGMIIGFRLFWVALLGLFLNVQFIAAGSANNFGYIWTNVIIMNVSKYAELIGVSGFLSYKKGNSVVSNGSKRAA